MSTTTEQPVSQDVCGEACPHEADVDLPRTDYRYRPRDSVAHCTEPADHPGPHRDQGPQYPGKPQDDRKTYVCTWKRTR